MNASSDSLSTQARQLHDLATKETKPTSINPASVAGSGSAWAAPLCRVRYSPRLFATAFFGAGDGDDVQGVFVKGGADRFDLTHQLGRCCLDGDAVVAAVGQTDAGEDEVSVACDRQVVRPIELEHQPFAGKSGDRASDGVAIGGAGDGDVVDGCAGDAAAALADRTSLFDRCGRRGFDADGVGAVFGQCIGEIEFAVGADCQIVRSVELEHQSAAGKPGDRTADGESCGR